MATSPDRGLSPAIGIALLIAIVAITTSVTGVFIFGLAGDTEGPPSLSIELEPTGDGVTFLLNHDAGETLLGNRTRLQGVADPQALHGRELRAGRAIEVVPVDREVTLFWDGEDASYTLQTFDVDAASLASLVGPINRRCAEAEQQMKNNSGDLDMNSEQLSCDITEDTDTGYSDIDLDLDDNSTLVGNIDTDGDVDVDSSIVVGDVTTTGNDITVTDGSEIYGDLLATSGTNIDVDGGSKVIGAVVIDGGSLNLANVDVDGHVYANPGDVSCSGSTIGPNDTPCSSYSFRNPENY